MLLMLYIDEVSSYQEVRSNKGTIRVRSKLEVEDNIQTLSSLQPRVEISLSLPRRVLPPVSVSRHSIPQLHWNVREERVIERQPHIHISFSWLWRLS